MLPFEIPANVIPFLEAGNIEPGFSDHALHTLAIHYERSGLTPSEASLKMMKAVALRSLRYPNSKFINSKRIERIIKRIYIDGVGYNEEATGGNSVFDVPTNSMRYPIIIKSLDEGLPLDKLKA